MSENTGERELLPCPFCSSANVRLEEAVYCRDEGEFPGVSCDDCEALGPCGDDVADAIDNWNRAWQAAIAAQPDIPAHIKSIKIPTDTMEQEFQKHYRRGHEAGKLAAQPERARAVPREPTEHERGIIADLEAIIADKREDFWPVALAIGALRMIRVGYAAPIATLPDGE